MTSEQHGSRLVLHQLTPRYISSGLVQNLVSPTPYVPPSKKDYEIQFQPLFDEYFNPLPCVVSPDLVVVTAPRAVDLVFIHQGDEEQIHGNQNAQFDNAPLLHNLSSYPSSKETTLQGVISSNLHHLNQSFDTLTKLTKNHPLENVIGDPSRLVSTRSQLQEHAIGATLTQMTIQFPLCNLFPLLGNISTVSIFLGFGLTFAGTSKISGVLRMLMIGLTLIPLVSKDDITMNASCKTCWSYSSLRHCAGSENRPPMLNKENNMPWSSRLLRYAKSRPNGKRIIPEPGDTNREVPVNETFHIQTDDELTEKELKQIEADDQAIQTILLGLPEDIYAAVDSCKTAQEIWLRVQQIMKGSDIGMQEKKAKLFNEWERFTSNEGESIESYYHRFLKLMNDLKRNKHFSKKIANELKAKRLAKTQDPLALMENSNNPYSFPAPHQDQPSFNQNYMQQPMPNLEDITDPTTAINMALALMAKAFKLNYSTQTNNNQRISSNPRNRQIAQPGMNMGQDRQMHMVGARVEGNATGHNGNLIRCYNCRGVGHFARNCTVRPRRRDAAYLQTQLLIAQKEEAGIQLQAEEFDLMAVAADLDEIEEVNANCILMANL
nr:hypothetical protein [Tanacetum cinerariifolium]